MICDLLKVRFAGVFLPLWASTVSLCMRLDSAALDSKSSSTGLKHHPRAAPYMDEVVMLPKYLN